MLTTSWNAPSSTGTHRVPVNRAPSTGFSRGDRFCPPAISPPCADRRMTLSRRGHAAHPMPERHRKHDYPKNFRRTRRTHTPDQRARRARNRHPVPDPGRHPSRHPRRPRRPRPRQDRQRQDAGVFHPAGRPARVGQAAALTAVRPGAGAHP